ncbi:MAG: PadR family transcriptional regulator [Nocardioidaceae bacterium]
MELDLSTTSYALLGLLVFADRHDETDGDPGLTGYELKQRSDYTLRFYWTSPAMSQIYTELGRLDRRGLAEPVEAKKGRRTSRRYRITPQGRATLARWLRTSEPEFPILKHPVALRLMMGHILGRDEVRAMLAAYAGRVRERRGELQAVRDMLGDAREVRFPAMVADWGLSYYDSEAEIAEKLHGRLEDVDDADEEEA